MFSRRNFIKRSGLVAAAAVGAPHIARSADPFDVRIGQRPKHIIHLVSDGTGTGTVSCGDHFSRLLRGRGLKWLELMNDPRASFAWMNTRSLNSLVPDSAAAASSWGSGSRVINGAINQLPDGRDLKTLYELFREAGWKRGLVTTTEITHATPAGFAANVDERDTGNLIAQQYLKREVDVLLGGGKKFFDGGQRSDKRDLKGEFVKAGYVVMEKLDELKTASRDKRWLGIFDNSNLPFTIDHMNDPKLVARIPTLATMTAAALDWLKEYPHFILQVEGGRIDHACHNCDAAAAMRDLVAFDEALEACIEFQKKVPDTLLVVTSDHGNGNMGLGGMGKSYGQSSWLFANTLKIKASFGEITKVLRRPDPPKPAADKTKTGDAKKDGSTDTASAKDKKTVTPAETSQEDNGPKIEDKDPKKSDKTATPAPKGGLLDVPEMVEALKTKTGLPYISARRTELFRAILDKKSQAIYEVMNNEMASLGQLLGNYIGVGWAGNVHTSDFIPITAVGPGAEKFRGFIQNTDVFYNYLALAGIDFKNPTEDFLAWDGKGPDASEVENPDDYTNTDSSALA